MGVRPAQSDIEPWLRPHLAALEASVRSGFRFTHLPKVDSVLAVQGFRVREGAMDMFLARSAFDALAARVRVEDLEFHASPSPLWHARGAVADVVMELLGLPPHGSPGAPTVTCSRPSDLWVPGDVLS
ncbi:hypothetical protein [Saccharopolyspora sp. ASAGF58]|uniref:hypothetical protein n=1 Tax=Saccharopolyspora sp. ASAGF58 TaxID=2719023 RepID=UPI001FF0A8B6|nr:hypothetical protein [Saccharopolyspora sp. ASAGF58]